MQKLKVLLMSFVIGFSFGLYVLSRPVYVSNPEPGVTCLQVDQVFTGNRVPAGCFSGDIYSPNHEFNEVATLKYQ